MSITNRKLNKILDVSDPKWAHPEAEPSWAQPMTEEAQAAAANSPFLLLGDSDKSLSEKQAVYDSLDFSMFEIPVDETKCTYKTYEVPGCPEEPDAPPVKVWVYTPLKTKKKMPVLFNCFGGGMLVALPRVLPIEKYCEKYNCVVVAAEYRSSVYAPYPGSVNDCHAAYKWVVDNAEELQIDPEKIVLFGESSGGHLATCLPFRLRRYGYSPRGVVAVLPITDDRERLSSSNYFGVDWTGAAVRRSYFQWMGMQNYASDSVGPEAFANHATVDDCIGYPPLFIHTSEFDADCDYSCEFASKVRAAHSFVSLHQWGGMQHGLDLGALPQCADQPLYQRIENIIDNDVSDCFKYDLRRPWVEEEA